MIMCVQDTGVSLVCTWVTKFEEQPDHEQVNIEVPDAYKEDIDVIIEIEFYPMLVATTILHGIFYVLQTKPHEDCRCANDSLHYSVEDV